MAASYGKGKGRNDDGRERPLLPNEAPSLSLAGRLPPQNLEAEQGVIGSVLLDNEMLHEVVQILKVDDFYRESHQIIFREITKLYDLAKPIDTIILEEELRRNGDLEKIGGLDALLAMVDSVPHSANARYYARIVREKAIARGLIHSANEIIDEGYSNVHTADELISSAEKKIFAIAEQEVSGETVELRKVIEKAMERIDDRASGKHAALGLSTGFLDLDDLTSGFQGAQLIILAARPSMGKTAFALNICEHVAIEQKIGVLFVSLEMGSIELAERLLCARAKIDGHKLRTGKGLGSKDMIQLSRGYTELNSGAPLLIDDTPSRNMLQITANARRLRLRQNIGLVVVDYIQLIDSEESRDSRQEQIAKISRRLKTLARELNVPVIALSQLNRGVETREDRRPRMSDLRESGAIEQDADLVLLLHRPEYYDPNDRPGVAELIVAKNRNGATGTVSFTFLKNFMRFENMANQMGPIDGDSF